MKQQQKYMIPDRGQFLKESGRYVPGREKVHAFLKATTCYLFPVLGDDSEQDCTYFCRDIEALLNGVLHSYDTGLSDPDLVTERFLDQLPGIYEILISDAHAIFNGDPAARSLEEVIICYPGFLAIMVYRIAHLLFKENLPVVPRMLTEYAHSKTGIDIHPGAHIGSSFCIDHGTGTVIGETTTIGDHVKIYQGVTLGAISVSKGKASVKRHPDIGDYVTIYSGATILGGKTHIGHHSVIGGNVWLTHSVAPWSVVLNKSEVILKNNHTNNNLFPDYII